MKVLNSKSIQNISLEDNGYQSFDFLDTQIKINDQNVILAVTVINMYEATGEDEYKDFPFAMGVSFLPENASVEIINDMTGEDTFKSQDEFNELSKDDKSSYYYDVDSYCGMCQIEAYLNEELDMEEIYEKLSVREAVVSKYAVNFGGLACEFGRGYEVDVVKFASIEAVEKYVKLLLNESLEIIDESFLENCLNRSCNLIGETWYKTFDTILGDAA
tara:strand:+ start:154 stop:804 length:651 start_codon:yes stop_codon:yes gene_type:complete